MATKILYSLSGDKRKALAKRIASILGAEAIYAGAPSFSYRIGDYIVDRSGNLICPGDTAPAALLEQLEADGFHGEPETEATAALETSQAAEPEDASATDTPAEEAPDTAPQNAAEEEPVDDSDDADIASIDEGSDATFEGVNHSETADEASSLTEEAAVAPETPRAAEPEDTSAADTPAEEAPDKGPQSAEDPASIDEEKPAAVEAPDITQPSEGGTPRLIISVPREDMDRRSISNLMNLVSSKATVLHHALQVDGTPILVGVERITFPWFPPTTSAEETKAYSQFVEALVRAAKEAKYVNPVEKDTDNEKLTMRLFLVTKLGFVGPEFKLARKLLTRHLSGNSSWRHGAPEKQNAPDTDTPETEVTAE